jgi:hypothetical protein
MPGMNRNSRSIRLIETCLADLEASQAAAPADAMLVLDEIRRLERKWNEQVAAGSTRRIKSDFKTMYGWYRRWLLATARLAGDAEDEALRAARRDVEQSLTE